MPFNVTETGFNNSGCRNVQTWRFTNTGGSTGGTVKTILTECHYAECSGATSLSFSGKDLTVVTSNASGYIKVEGI